MEEQVFAASGLDESKTLVRQFLDVTFGHVRNFLYGLCGPGAARQPKAGRPRSKFKSSLSDAGPLYKWGRRHAMATII